MLPVLLSLGILYLLAQAGLAIGLAGTLFEPGLRHIVVSGDITMKISLQGADAVFVAFFMVNRKQGQVSSIE